MNTKTNQSLNHQEVKVMCIKRFTLLIISLLVYGGCGELVSPDISLTEGYQVFGIRAEPPVARPDDQVVVTVYDHHPTQQDVTYSWSLCLYSHGAAHATEQSAFNNFACLKELSVTLGGDMKPRVVIDLGERDVNLRKRLRALGQTRDTNRELRSLEEGLDIYVVLSSGDPREGLVRSVKRIHVIDAPEDEVLQSNPVIKGWSVRESGVANLLPSCVMNIDGPETSLRYNEAGEVIAGTLRSSVIDEITGRQFDENDEEQETCSLHNQSILDMQVQVEGAYETEWSLQEGYTYRWYISDDQRVITPVSNGGTGYGRFELAPNLRSSEILVSVRDPHGGFTMGRQKLLLVEGVSIR